jgi:hypothetical protein
MNKYGGGSLNVIIFLRIHRPKTIALASKGPWERIGSLGSQCGFTIYTKVQQSESNLIVMA